MPVTPLTTPDMGGMNGCLHEHRRFVARPSNWYDQLTS
jgi:hypothetical protein